MTIDEFNAFCGCLMATSYVVQWRGAHVWKVGGKLFAIGTNGPCGPAFTFKVSDVGYEVFKEVPGMRPAPYLASRGMKWIQHYRLDGPSDADLQDCIRQSHEIVAAGLPKKRQRELGLLA